MAEVSGPLSLRERYAGMVYGSLAGDALALAAHWIYDQAEIKKRFGDSIRDLEPPARSDYHPGKGRGDQTHYGDQELILIDSLEACGGNFVLDDFLERWRQFWRGSQAYRDHATKETIMKFDSGIAPAHVGSDSTELGGPGRIAPLLAALRDEELPTIIAAARAQTILTHATPLALDGAEFLTHLVAIIMRGTTIRTALQGATAFSYRALPAEDYLRAAEGVANLPLAEAIVELGQSCPIEKALPSVFAILLRHGENAELALEENVQAGGDSAARGLVLGMVLGAAHGRRALPDRWVNGLAARPRVEAFLHTVGLGGMA